ncbi:hypothetical protein LCGC14_0559670 [marine sediment metagenome]|uniref:Uncharacterized protein n=2 Tax=root TaxID=1 RepID=A0A831QNB8_9FLAO|nr:hypothetical protein [Pricia antarctica]
MYEVYFFLLLLLFLNSCKNDDNRELDCSTALCQANFAALYVEFIDRENDENVLDNGTYTINDIDLEGSESVNFEIDNTLDKQYLVITDSIWEIGSYEYSLTIGNTNEFKFVLNLERSGGEGCCSNILIAKTLEVNGDSKEVEFDPIISVFVE